MREYIVNLTNNLIGKHRFDLLVKNTGRSRFRKLVADHLEALDVAKMSPETLGRIMASFEIGDLMVSKEELFSSLHFCGDAEALLRELVARCLALAIQSRFDSEETAGFGVPAYRRGKEK